MTLHLPPSFLRVPLAHRALHDTVQRRPENSRAAVKAAIDAGYGIEIDLQISADGEALVFHDYTLDRLTTRTDRVNALCASECSAIKLLNSDDECIPTLTDILDIVGGRVPLLIEVKNQVTEDGPGIGPLEAATVRALTGYRGDVAVMSFNPDSVAEMARLAPDLPRGLTTCSYQDPEDRAGLDEATIAWRYDIGDFDRVGAAFISHEVADLPRPRIQALRSAGVPVLCWTVKSLDQEAEARRYADNVTFERYLSPLPA